MRKVPWQERFWPKVDKDGPVALWRGAPGCCWIWTASTAKGYGNIRADGGVRYAHRLSYELAHGPIPDGLYIDHRCRRTRCVNPAHLEAVTNAENVRRGNAGLKYRLKTHCKNGHPYDEENTVIRADGTGRSCRECHRQWTRESRDRKERMTHG